VTIALAERTQYLKTIHLFRGLDDIQIAEIAGLLEEKNLTTGASAYLQGDVPDGFYLIYSGSVRLVRKQGETSQQLAALVAGDYFGEEVLIKREKRATSVYMQSGSCLLFLPGQKLTSLLKSWHTLRVNFEVAITSFILTLQLHFDWLEPAEVVYFLARKHSILLWQAMIAPALVSLLPIGLLTAFLFTSFVPLVYVALAAVLLDLLWAAWRAVDWGNDYYIVTNLRVIWLEKVVGFYDSRQEAPLSTILSVGVETDQSGRLLDYGNVIVRTFVGKIIFSHVPHPNQAAYLVEEQWLRAKQASQKTDVQALKNSIRQKLGLPLAEAGRSSATSPAPTMTDARVTWLKRFIERVNIFKVRFEDQGGTITYRKHWIVLFLQTWLPGLILLVSIALALARAAALHRAAASGPDSLLAILVAVAVISFFWWVYQVWDWSNDIFQVTQDQIYDIDRKPLGREERRSAMLDNILSTEADRRGLFQVLFNYGDVYISIGGMRMDFFDVYDPRGVQQDIDRRRMARLERKQEEEGAAERERLAQYFAMYHQAAEEFQKEQDGQAADKRPDHADDHTEDPRSS
jgi:hypothetical protein